MKTIKKFILLLLIPAFILSCSNDDDNIVIEQENIETGVIRITQVDAEADLVVLSNLGTSNTDIGGYFLCLGPGTYVRVSDVATGSTNLTPNQSIALPYDVNEVADGLSIFSTNTFTSNDPNILVDYLQWGAGNQARVSQAVTAGRWDNADNFVTVGTSYNFTGEADEFGSAFYETVGAEAAPPVVRILQVDAASDLVWLSNFGTESIDVADYFLCLGPGTYVRVSAAANGASTNLAPGANVMLSYDVDEAADGLSIFSEGGNFGSTDPSVLVDYLQWGAGNQARVSQAVTAGRWDNADNFVTVGTSYNFTGEADEFGSTFYETVGAEATPPIVRILQVDAASDLVWLSNFGTESIDVADYFLCLGPGTYVRVSAAANGASTNLAPGENVMLSYNVEEAVDGLSIFSEGGNFGSTDPNVLVDYVQWGGANQARVSQAVTAGRWDDAANFITNGPVYTFNGEADEFGSTFW